MEAALAPAVRNVSRASVSPNLDSQWFAGG